MRPPSNVFPLDPTKPLIPVDVLLEGPRGRQLIRMALDTGATYTIASVGAIRAIGYDPAASPRRIDFVAAGLLGLNFLKHVSIHLDFPHHLAKVTRDR